MRRFMRPLRLLIRLAGTLLILLVDAARFLLLCLRPSAALAAENLFLRKQLALYQERHVTPRRATNPTRWFGWRRALAIVQPATLIRWHRQRKHDADLMIAAIVAMGQHILVTRNQVDFRDVLPRAQLANWIDDPPEASLP